MNFNDYLNDAWKSHDLSTAVVVAGYEEGLRLAGSEDQILSLVRLVAHIAVEHNFQFGDAIATLQKISTSPFAQSGEAFTTLRRQIATMNYLANPESNISHYSVSERTMIFAAASAAALKQKEDERAEAYLKKAVSASHALKQDDPAFRVLATYNNNMANELESRPELNDLQKQLMMTMAHYSRQFWEMAGTWMQVERAEYFMSQCARKIFDYEKAITHAKACLHICESEKAAPAEIFFAHEALALAYKALEQHSAFQNHVTQIKDIFEQCSAEDQKWMRKYFDKVTA